MTLTEALPVHAAAMAAIHACAFPPSEAWDAAVFAAQLASPGGFGLIACQGNEVGDAVGGLILARTAADEAEVLTLAVDPGARRRGLGRELLEAAMDRAAAAGARAMLLEAAADNRPARALYETAGFREAGRRRRYYESGADALILRAELAPCGAGSSPSRPAA